LSLGSSFEPFWVLHQIDKFKGVDHFKKQLADNFQTMERVLSS